MGYIPKQITTFLDYPTVLYATYAYNGKFKAEIEYLWSLENTDENLLLDYLIIPDGCIDIITNFSDENNLEIFVSKPFTRATKIKLSGKFKYCGIRCKPGMALKFLNFFPGNIKLAFQIINIKDKFTDTEQLKYLGIEEYSELLLKYLDQQPKSEILSRSLKDWHIKKEYSERHYRRLHRLITGFSPKTFLKIIKANQNISDPEGYLLDYYDQSHYIKTFKELTGFTPKQFFEKFRV